MAGTIYLRALTSLAALAIAALGAVLMASGTALAEDAQPDQQQTESNEKTRLFETWQQSFTAGWTGDLTKVSLKIGCCIDNDGNYGTPPDRDLDVHIFSTDSLIGNPCDAASTEEHVEIIGHATVPKEEFGPAYDGDPIWVDAILDSPVVLYENVQYGVAANSKDALGANPGYLWASQNSDVYAGGYPCWFYPFAPWTPVMDKEMTFKTYMTPEDTTAPETSIDTGPSGTINTDSATFTFSANESDSRFQCTIDQVTWYACTSPRTYTGLSEGTYTFEVQAYDRWGNADPSPATRTFTVDLPDPVVPHITDTDPNNGDTGVARTIKPTVTLDTDLKADTVTPQNVTLQVYNTKRKKWVTVSSTPSYSNKVITVTPTNTLGSQKRYRVVLNTNIKSSTDKNLEQPFRFRFTTGK